MRIHADSDSIYVTRNMTVNKAVASQAKQALTCRLNMLQEGLKKLTIFLINVLEVESSSRFRDSLGHRRTDITISHFQDWGSWFKTTSTLNS